MTWNPLSRSLPKPLRYSCAAIITMILVLQVAVVGEFATDRRFLVDLADQIADPTSPPSEQVKQMTDYMRGIPLVTNHSYMLLPVFRPLRPTARQVVEKGGDCSDRSRLLIRLTEIRGIDSSKWALYSSDQRPQHAVVEVQTEIGPMVVDPLFGLWFPRPDGGYYGIAELRNNASLLQDRLLELISRGERPGADRLEHYPVDLYIYTHARTINWDKSWFTNFIYRCLDVAIGERTQTLPRPSIVEKPALMIFWFLVALQAATYAFFVALGALVLRRETQRRSSRNSV